MSSSYLFLFKFSLFIRLILTLSQVIFNHTVPDHDADAFRLPYEPETTKTDRFISFLFEGFSRWDAQYFLHVSLYGYTHENTLAFFPAFPVLMRYLSHLLNFILPAGVVGPLHCSLLAGVFLNAFSTSAATVFLYKLTLHVFQSELLAYTSALLFTINPASIFFSALYSESLFALLTFIGLQFIATEKIFFGTVALALSCTVRSNGILSVGFVIYAILKQYFNSRRQYFYFYQNLFILCCKIVFYTAIFSIPFCLHQMYCYALYCTSVFPDSNTPDLVLDFLTQRDLMMPSELSKWCNWRIPLAYSYVQSRYWNVGFLKYYTFKQIPNFLLAAPIFIVVVIGCYKYFSVNKNKLWHVGLKDSNSLVWNDIYNNGKCFSYFIHIFATTIFGALFIHIQVLTRLLCSSSPVLYWIAAASVLPFNEHVKFKLMKEHFHQGHLCNTLQFLKKVFIKSSTTGKFMISYFIAYFLIGTFLHVNFLPWT